MIKLTRLDLYKGSLGCGMTEAANKERSDLRYATFDVLGNKRNEKLSNEA
ncbi:hypothetical protein [Cytobacillus firmus]|nr:hypothetical protein [Cytobacillus firmus]